MPISLLTAAVPPEPQKITRWSEVPPTASWMIWRAARGGVVGVGDAPRPVRAVEHLALADDPGPDRVHYGRSRVRGQWANHGNCHRGAPPLLYPLGNCSDQVDGDRWRRGQAVVHGAMRDHGVQSRP